MSSIAGKALAEGSASGELIMLDEALSFWGGVEIASGIISDRTHPQCGTSLAGKVVAMRTVRGSSSASSALVECIRQGTGPAAILLTEADPILLIGCLVGAELYGVSVPLVVIRSQEWNALSGAARASVVTSNGQATISLHAACHQ